MSLFWFELLSWMPNHLLCWDAAQFPASLKAVAGDLAGRSLIVKKARTIPLECIVRGYLIGSGWKDYRKNGRVCGIPLPAGYQQAQKLTPDSSRFWPKSDYRVGCSPPSLDKQFVRDYLESLDWDKTPPAPALPEEIVMKTREKYVEALKALSGKTLA